MLSELSWAPRKSVSCCVHIEALGECVREECQRGGGRTGSELIKVKITKQVTLSVICPSSIIYFLLAAVN